MYHLETAEKHVAELTANGNDHAQEQRTPPASSAPTTTPSPTKGQDESGDKHVNSVSNMPTIKSKSDPHIPPRGILQSSFLYCLMIFYC